MHPFTPRTAAATLSTLAMLLIALGFPGAALAAAADGAPSWTVGTAANDFGSDRQNYSYTLDPGGRLDDGLVVANTGTTPLHLTVYAADAYTTGGGGVDLVGKDEKSTGVGAWVRAERPDVTVEPGKSAEVPFTVTLPDNAAPGEYLGGIVTSPSDAAGQGERRGIRIRLRVGGALKPSLSVQDLQVRYAGTPNPFGKGEATVTYTIRNTGNAILNARQAVSLSGPFGSMDVQAGRIEDSPQLLPGDTWKVSVPVRGVAPLLRLTGKVTLTPLITDAANSVSPLAAVETTTDAWASPWALLGCLVVLCALVVAAVLTLRRRRALKRV